MLEVWPAALVTGGVFATVQFLVSNYIGPQLTDILSSLTAMAALVGLLRIWKPRREQQLASNELGRAVGRTSELTNYKLVQGEEMTFATAVLSDTARTDAEYATRERLFAWMPYILLVVFVLLWGFKPFQSTLNAVTIAFPWPYLHNLIQRVPPAVTHATSYPAFFSFNWLSASGTSCMFATLLSALLLKMPARTFARLLISTARELAFAILTIAAVLSMAFVMNYSGITRNIGACVCGNRRGVPLL